MELGIQYFQRYDLLIFSFPPNFRNVLIIRSLAFQLIFGSFESAVVSNG